MDSVNLETLRQAVAWQAAGLPVTLAGTDVRVADVPAVDVRSALDHAEVIAEVREVAATIEERMTVLAAQQLEQG